MYSGFGLLAVSFAKAAAELPGFQDLVLAALQDATVKADAAAYMWGGRLTLNLAQWLVEHAPAGYASQYSAVLGVQLANGGYVPSGESGLVPVTGVQPVVGTMVFQWPPALRITTECAARCIPYAAENPARAIECAARCMGADYTRTDTGEVIIHDSEPAPEKEEDEGSLFPWLLLGLSAYLLTRED